MELDSYHVDRVSSVFFPVWYSDAFLDQSLVGFVYGRGCQLSDWIMLLENLEGI